MKRLASAALVLLWAACSESPQTPADPATTASRPLSVQVVNYPLQYLAERIGGPEVAVTFAAPRDVDPARWSPDSETVAAVLSERFGLDPRVSDNKVLLNRERVHELIPRIVEALPDGALHSVSMRHTGLGEVFLELTGHELTEQAESAESTSSGRQDRVGGDD